MNVIVMGCGRLGSRIAGILDSEGHSVTVLDVNESAFRRLPEGFHGKRAVGNGMDAHTRVSSLCGDGDRALLTQSHPDQGRGILVLNRDQLRLCWLLSASSPHEELHWRIRRYSRHTDQRFDGICRNTALRRDLRVYSRCIAGPPRFLESTHPLLVTSPCCRVEDFGLIGKIHRPTSSRKRRLLA